MNSLDFPEKCRYDKRIQGISEKCFDDPGNVKGNKKSRGKKVNADREDMKKKNRGMVLKLVATGRCSSRIELSKTMGLTKTAISKIVAELIENGFLAETKKQENAELGRNPIGLDLADTAPLLAGVLIMRDYCEAVLCNMKLEIVKHQKVYQSWNSKEELMETVYSVMDQVLYGAEHVGGIGVASIGPLDSIEGVIEAPPLFHGIHDVPVAKLLKERYHLPVVCDNDNQSAALAEKLFGKGKDSSDILLVGLSNGVGCGIISGDEKYQSSSGYTPEIGHLSIDYKGERCVCGNRGCLEMYLNSPGVLKRMREVTGKFYDYKTFCQLATEEPTVGVIFEELVEKLSAGLVSVVNILNPELIIIGHDGAWWPQKYLQMLEEEINSRKFSNKQNRIRVVSASYGETTAVLGAVCNILTGYFQGEML